MKTTDHSFGIIAYHFKGNTIHFLFVWEEEQAYWCFPKGHAKKRESPLNTARRKFQEETGLMAKNIVTRSRPLSQYYSFWHKGTNIKKEVTYFLSQVDPATQTNIPRTTRWMTIEEFSSVTKYQDMVGLAREASAIVCEA